MTNTNQAACSITQFTPEVQERFWRKVDKNGPTPDPVLYGDIGACWVWTAGRDSDGYGIFKARISIRAHRLSWKIQVGAIPCGLWVLHRCDNPSCVNPSHLWLGTQADNDGDRVAKNRSVKGNQCSYEMRPRGEMHGRAKITKSDVLEIRRLHSSGMKCHVIAEKFPISSAAVDCIVKRINWRHIP